MSEDRAITQFAVGEFLDELASRTPAPGGGAAAALAGALSCALARMVAAYSVSKSTDPATTECTNRIHSKLERADRMLRSLADEDVAAYQRLAVAMRERGKPGANSGEYDSAIRMALAVPMEMAAVLAGAISIMRELTEVANRKLMSDLGAAAAIARGAARAANYVAEVNAGQLTEYAERNRAIESIERIIKRCDLDEEAVRQAVADASRLSNRSGC
jgi:formiminotetrahydrofolate cyclodeaminase